MPKRAPEDFNDYLAGFPPKVRALLRKVRATIKAAAPDAVETISYRIPAFRIGGRVAIWFGAFTTHVGFFPGADGIAAFKEDLARYKSAKGSVQFPFEQPLPLDLIERIVRFRLLKAEAASTSRANPRRSTPRRQSPSSPRSRPTR